MQRHISIRRSQSGVNAIEVAVATFFVVVIAAIGVDLSILTSGFTILDAATRDAARAAAAQQTALAALDAAKAQLATHQTDGKFLQQPIVKGNTIDYQDFGGKTPTYPQSPYVTVACQMKMRLPVTIPFFGLDIAHYIDPTGYFTFTRAYTFPIVRKKYFPPTP